MSMTSPGRKRTAYLIVGLALVIAFGAGFGVRTAFPAAGHKASSAAQDQLTSYQPRLTGGEAAAEARAGIVKSNSSRRTDAETVACSASDFNQRTRDWIVICTYPRTGTNWTFRVSHERGTVSWIREHQD